MNLFGINGRLGIEPCIKSIWEAEITNSCRHAWLHPNLFSRNPAVSAAHGSILKRNGPSTTWAGLPALWTKTKFWMNRISGKPFAAHEAMMFEKNWHWYKGRAKTVFFLFARAIGSSLKQPCINYQFVHISRQNLVPLRHWNQKTCTLSPAYCGTKPGFPPMVANVDCGGKHQLALQ